MNMDNVFTLTRNYDHNEFLSEQDYELFERMKVESPRRYQIEGRGDWGVAEGLIYSADKVRVEDFDVAEMEAYSKGTGARYVPVYGLDFGFSSDPTAFIYALVDEKNYTIYICDEWYKYNQTNLDIIAGVTNIVDHNVFIYADSADPRTINELRMLGLPNIKGVKKGRDSILAGIKKLQDYDIVVHPSCSNIQTELSMYCWAKDKQTDKLTEKPMDDFNHALDALRYACQDINRRNYVW